MSICTRRHVLASAAGALAGLGLARPACAGIQKGLGPVAAGINPYLVGATSAALMRHEPAIWSRDVIAIVDFGLPSSARRFHLVDLLNGTIF